MDKPSDHNVVEQNKNLDKDKLLQLKEKFLQEKEAKLKERQDKNKLSKKEIEFRGKMRTAIG